MWLSGAYYQGQWKNDLRHGTGFYKAGEICGTWPAGSEFTGTWLNGKRHGFGKIKYRDLTNFNVKSP